MITAMTAYRYCDNYAIETADGSTCYGCEHNQQEADAIARYLESYHGRHIVVRKNSKDEVRLAQSLRPTPYRVQNRHLILKEMGVWS